MDRHQRDTEIKDDARTMKQAQGNTEVVWPDHGMTAYACRFPMEV
jgi:hypothetical protein